MNEVTGLIKRNDGVIGTGHTLVAFSKKGTFRLVGPRVRVGSGSPDVLMFTGTEKELLVEAERRGLKSEEPEKR